MLILLWLLVAIAAIFTMGVVLAMVPEARGSSPGRLWRWRIALLPRFLSTVYGYRGVTVRCTWFMWRDRCFAARHELVSDDVPVRHASPLVAYVHRRDRSLIRLT